MFFLKNEALRSENDKREQKRMLDYYDGDVYQENFGNIIIILFGTRKL